MRTAVVNGFTRTALQIMYGFSSADCPTQGRSVGWRIMNGKQILEDFGMCANAMLMMRGDLIDITGTVMRGQMTALAIACSSDDESTRKAAVQWFQFFTMQCFGYLFASASVDTIKRMEPSQQFILSDPEEFASEHKTLRNSDVLRDEQMKVMREWIEALQPKVIELAGTLQAEMLKILKPVEFADHIDE